VVVDETGVALSAEQALQRVQTKSFDLITVEIGIPGLDGFRLVQRLKGIARLRDTPVVFVTGLATIENRERAFALGAADFIEKPFDIREFAARIRSAVTRTASTACTDIATPVES
jgi:DNA-binding response OmpR family regulator